MTRNYLSEIYARQFSYARSNSVKNCNAGQGRRYRTQHGWWGGDTDKGISAQTFNLYLSNCKAFCAWAVRDGRASRSPLEHAKSLNTRTDRRRVRRSLSVEETGGLLAATAAEPERFTMTGPRRALLYRLAIETGLRTSELGSLPLVIANRLAVALT